MNALGNPYSWMIRAARPRYIGQIGLCIVVVMIVGGCEEGPPDANLRYDLPSEVASTAGPASTQHADPSRHGQTHADDERGSTESTAEPGDMHASQTSNPSEDRNDRQPADNQSASTTPEEDVDPCLNGIDPGSVLPRRLSTTEYWNAIDDLFGIDARDLAAFPPDEEVLGFDNQASSLQASPIHAEAFRGSAEAIAEIAVQDIDTLLDCQPNQTESDCLTAFIERFGTRAWRRPLQNDEIERLSTLAQYGRTIADGGVSRGVSLVIEAMLQSPHFLYRIEVGTADIETNGWRPLTSYEMASRLSFFLWRTIPDDELLAAAAADRLTDEEEIGRQVDRMLADPRSEAAFWTFFEQWLHLDEIKTLVRDPLRHPSFNGFRRSAMMADARHFIRQIVWDEGAPMTELFDRPFSVEACHRHDEPVYLPILMAGSHLKPNMTSPIHRGVFVREALLCMALPPPPPEAMVVAPDPIG